MTITITTILDSIKPYAGALIQLLQTTNYKSILYHLVVFISYVLCFVYLYRPNTEMVSVVLFFILHISLLGFLIMSKITIPSLAPKGVSSWDITQIFNINYTEYSLGFIAVHWVLLLFALYWLVAVYIRLYMAYIPYGKDMTFGNMESTKESLFRYLITGTVFMWVFYIIQNTKQLYQAAMSKYRILNSFVLILAVLSIMNSVSAFTLSSRLNDKLHTIVVQRDTK
jgi:hypothetical protein